MALQISVTPKMHSIFYHVKEFCKANGIGLGFFVELAFESVHHDYNETWKNFKFHEDHENYGKAFLRSVCTYNSQHL